VLSVSLWWYKAAILGWALWLSFALTGWIKWAWQVFTRDGLWRAGRPAEPAPARGVATDADVGPNAPRPADTDTGG